MLISFHLFNSIWSIQETTSWRYSRGHQCWRRKCSRQLMNCNSSLWRMCTRSSTWLHILHAPLILEGKETSIILDDLNWSWSWRKRKWCFSLQNNLFFDTLEHAICTFSWWVWVSRWLNSTRGEVLLEEHPVDEGSSLDEGQAFYSSFTLCFHKVVWVL